MRQPGDVLSRRWNPSPKKRGETPPASVLDLALAGAPLPPPLVLFPVYRSDIDLPISRSLPWLLGVRCMWLQVGLRADVNVIDMTTLRLHQPRIVHDLPTGASRWIQTATGYRMTMVYGNFDIILA